QQRPIIARRARNSNLVPELARLLFARRGDRRHLDIAQPADAFRMDPPHESRSEYRGFQLSHREFKNIANWTVPALGAQLMRADAGDQLRQQRRPVGDAIYEDAFIRRMRTLPDPAQTVERRNSE